MFSLHCHFCEHVNPVGAKFCSDCGVSLNLRPCKACAAASELAAAACRVCGAALAPVTIESTSARPWSDLESDLAALESELAIATAKARARQPAVQAPARQAVPHASGPAPARIEALRADAPTGTGGDARPPASQAEGAPAAPARGASGRTSWFVMVGMLTGVAILMGIYALHREPIGAASSYGGGAPASADRALQAVAAVGSSPSDRSEAGTATAGGQRAAAIAAARSGAVQESGAAQDSAVVHESGAAQDSAVVRDSAVVAMPHSKSATQALEATAATGPAVAVAPMPADASRAFSSHAVPIRLERAVTKDAGPGKRRAIGRSDRPMASGGSSGQGAPIHTMQPSRSRVTDAAATSRPFETRVCSESVAALGLCQPQLTAGTK